MKRIVASIVLFALLLIPILSFGVSSKTPDVAKMTDEELIKLKADVDIEFDKRFGESYVIGPGVYRCDRNIPEGSYVLYVIKELKIRYERPQLIFDGYNGSKQIFDRIDVGEDSVLRIDINNGETFELVSCNALLIKIPEKMFE